MITDMIRCWPGTNGEDLADGLYVGDSYQNDFRGNTHIFYRVAEDNCDLGRAMELVRSNITPHTKVVLIHPFNAELTNIARIFGDQIEMKNEKIKELLHRVKECDEELRKSHPNTVFMWILSKFVKPKAKRKSLKPEDSTKEYNFNRMIKNLNVQYSFLRNLKTTECVGPHFVDSDHHFQKLIIPYESLLQKGKKQETKGMFDSWFVGFFNI